MIESKTSVPRDNLPVSDNRAARSAARGTDFRDELELRRERAEGRRSDARRGASPGRDSTTHESGARLDRSRAVGEPRAHAEADAPAGEAQPPERPVATDRARAEPARAGTTSPRPHSRGGASSDPNAALGSPEGHAAAEGHGLASGPLPPLALPAARPELGASRASAEPAAGAVVPEESPVAPRIGSLPTVALAPVGAPSSTGADLEALAADLARAPGEQDGAGRAATAAIAVVGGTSAASETAPIESRPAHAPLRLPPAEVPAFLQKLAVRLDGAGQRAVVELEPPDLGRLSVELSIEPEGGVRASVRAERPDGYAALEARLPELRAALVERGFQNADVQLHLGLPQRDARRGHDAPEPRGRSGGSELTTERVLSLAPARAGSIDLWA